MTFHHMAALTQKGFKPPIMAMIDTPYVPEPAQVPLPSEPSGPDMALLLRRVVRGLPIIVLLCLLCTVGGYVLMGRLPAKFTSSVSILIDPKQPGTYGAETEFSSAFVDNSKISSVEIVLQSSNLLREVVGRLHLADDPYYGDFQPARLDALVNFVTGRKSAPVIDTQEQRVDRAVGRLWQSVRPARIGTTYVVKLDVTAPDPKRAAQIAGAIADTYIGGLLNSRLDAAKRDAAWLTDRLKTQREELIKSENEVASIQQKFGLVGNDAKDDAAVDRQSVGGVNQELIAAQGDLAAIESRYQAAVAIARSGSDTRSLPDVANSPVIQDLQKKQAEAAARLATLSARYSSDYPGVRQVRREVDAINRMLAQETQRIIEGLKTQYMTALAHKGALTTEMDRLVGKVTATASAEGQAELREAQRVSEANRVAYEASLTKLREVQQQESRMDVEARIISAPDFPSSPSFPRPIQILPASSILGLLLGLGLTFVLPLGKPKIETAAEVERSLSLHVLGTVPRLLAAQLRHDNKTISIPEYITLFPFSVFAECVRLLRYRIQAQKRTGGRVLQVTSSVPGEGKSTIAASLAISAATGNVRTVLIDLDLHRPGASRLLGNSTQAGVVDFLLGNATAESALHSHPSLPISIIGAGTFDTLRPGLIESQQLADLIAKLRRSYELVIIDTPPILAVSDAVFISRFADVTILIVGWRDTPRHLIEKTVDVLRAAGAPLAGIVLNKVSQGRQLTYGSDVYGYNNSEKTAAPRLT